MDSSSRFAVVLDTPPRPERLSPEAINARFYEWAQNEPEDALVAATHIEHPVTRQLAIQSALAGWACKAPSTLAETALSFPDGVEKTAALTQAFRVWMLEDPKLAGDWLQAHAEQMPIAEQAFRADSG